MKIYAYIFAFVLSLPALAADSSSPMSKPIDQRSYRLGGVGSFSEMVGVGVKTLALSAAIAPDEMDELEADIRQIAKDAGVKIGGELYSDSMGEAGSPGETYIGMMRENVLTLVEALKE